MLAFEVLYPFAYFELDAANGTAFFLLGCFVFFLWDGADGLGREACFWLGEGAACEFLDDEARVPGGLYVSIDLYA